MEPKAESGALTVEVASSFRPAVSSRLDRNNKIIVTMTTMTILIMIMMMTALIMMAMTNSAVVDH